MFLGGRNVREIDLPLSFRTLTFSSLSILSRVPRRTGQVIQKNRHEKSGDPQNTAAGPHAVLRAQTKQNSGSAVIERHQLSFDALTALEAFALNLFSPNDLKKTSLLG